MAKFKPYQCLEDQLSFLPIEDGQLILTTDTRKIYLDTNDTRILYGENTNINMEEIGISVIVDFDVNPLG